MILFLLILVSVIECVIIHYFLYKCIGYEATFKEYLFGNKDSFYGVYKIILPIVFGIILSGILFLLNISIYNTFIK